MCLTCYECTKCGAVLHKDCHKLAARTLECPRGSSTAGRPLRPSRSVRRFNVSLEGDDDVPPSPQASPSVSDDAPGSPAPQHAPPPLPRMPSYLMRRPNHSGSATPSSLSVSPAVSSEEGEHDAVESAEPIHEEVQGEEVPEEAAADAEEEPVVPEEEPVAEEAPQEEPVVEEYPVEEEPPQEEHIEEEYPAEEEPVTEEYPGEEEPSQEEPVEEPVEEEYPATEEPSQEEPVEEPVEDIAEVEEAHEETPVQDDTAGEEDDAAADAVAPAEEEEQEQTKSVNEEGEGEEGETEEHKESPEEERKRKRALAVQELVETEMAYYQDLLVVVSVYLDPLKNNPKTSSLVTPLQMRDIFSNFEVFPQLHSDLLSQLLQPNSTVADSFLQYADYFRMYVMYCNNLDKQDATVNNLLATSPPFAAFARVCSLALTLNFAAHGLWFSILTGVQKAA